MLLLKKTKACILLCALLLSLILSAEAQVKTNIHYQKVFKYQTVAGRPAMWQRNAWCPPDEIRALFNKQTEPMQLDISAYKKFPKAVLFPKHVFELSVERRQQANIVFQPLIDSILAMPTTRDTLFAEILIVGYSDETPRMEDIIAYDYLCRQSRASYLDQRGFMDWFSFIRARETGSVLMDLLETNNTLMQNFTYVVIDLRIEGRGGEKPDPQRSYDDIDEKRRIAKVYWRILP
ncbi:MAG: hypothetical protein JNM44_00885 [Chitinophagaceae bacterium]|nr:hypothetical protein [Chitinophagaceae bacterium]